MAQSVIRNTQQEAVVKVWGAAGVTETIDLQTLMPSNQELDGETQTVTILGVTWTGGTDGIATVTRNGAVIMTLQANAAGMLLFDGQTMPPESTNATHDIVVAITGAACEVWLKVRKAGGYKSKSGEYASYGAYEDETRVGASTTVNGSPDYVPPGD